MISSLRAESHCDQWCATGAICDCTWDDTTNTLTINSGSFTHAEIELDEWYTEFMPAFFGADYNINVVGDNITWDEDAFAYTSGNINYSGNNAEFFYDQYGTFGGASGNVTITGNNITLDESAFDNFSGNAYLLGENIDLSSAGYTAYQSTGSFTVSPAILQTMYNIYDFNGQIYCTQDQTQCDQVLANIGHSDIKSQPCQNCNKPTKVLKRIYTVEEAAAVVKPTGNTFKIRYR